MTFTREQRQAAYNRLQPDIQDIITSSWAAELVSSTLKEAGLTEDQRDLADSEILYALFCLQSLDDAINNIAKLSNKNLNDLSKIKLAVQDNILNKYKIDIKEFIETNKSELIASTSVPEIPPANLPMVEKGEVVHDVPHVELTTENQRPAVQEQLKKDTVSLPDYRYPDGKDPYREPLK